MRPCRRPRVLLVGVAAGLVLSLLTPGPASAGVQPCAIPGTDGPGGTLAGVIDTYYPGTTTVAAGATSISVGSPSGSAAAINTGDLLLVIEMQDEAINSSNTSAYGAGTTSGAGFLTGTAGIHEYVVAAGPVAGGSVPIRGAGSGGGLVNSYVVGAASATHGQSDFQLVRVPQYSTATLGSTLTAQPWNGVTGGILAFDVAGALSLGSATVSVDGTGFRGGGGRKLSGGTGGSKEDFRNLSTKPFHGNKGEGAAGTPEWVYNQRAGTVVNTEQANDGYPNGSTAMGAPGNGGGGGTDANPTANDQNSGGGGGGNGGSGGQGGNSWNTNLPVGGRGGAAFSASATALVLGGGGGSGTRNNSTAGSSSGGAGGGIVLIRAGSVTGTGTITANGAVGPPPENDGGGGGGAGGSIEVLAKSGELGGLTADAIGGNGANAWPTGGGLEANRHGPGGGGAGGVVVTSAAPKSATVTGGPHGTTTENKYQYNAQNGTAGTTATAAISAPTGAGPGSVCLPSLTTTKSTSTPVVTNTSSGTAATYTIILTNGSELGTAQQVTVSDVLPSGFTYASTGSFTTGGEATRTTTVTPSVGETNPTWGTVTMPGGSTVTVTFTVTIAASVAPGGYTNSAGPSYLDPQRNTPSGQASGAGTGPTALVEVAPSADIAVTKTASAAAINDGQEVTYTVTAKNNGPDAASGVALTDLLPAGLEYVSSTSSQGSYERVEGIWTVGELANDALATLTVTAKATKTGSITNTATKTAEEQNDPVAANNSASATVEVAPSADIADLALEKTATTETVKLPSEVAYTLTVSNAGPDAAQGVVVTDPLPAGETYVGDDAGCTVAGQMVTCGLGELASKVIRTIHLRVRVGVSLGERTVTNTAEVASATADPNLHNNIAAASLRTGPAAGVPARTGPAAGVPASTRVTLRKLLRQRSVAPGDRLAYRLTVHNAGTSAAERLRVCDRLPQQTTVVSRGGGHLVAGRICFALARLAPGQSHFFAVVLRADSDASVRIVNRATVTGANFHPARAQASARVRLPGLSPSRTRGVTG
jgi:uncharacterized repeat protein (TIGR01451 family)/fimbrial isopeptide formation D2 family protein